VAAGLPVVPWVTVTGAQWSEAADAVEDRCRGLGLPVFVKPAVGGSSVGVGKVNRPGELREAIEHALHFDAKILVEKGIVGRELECSVLGHGAAEGAIEASGVGEIVPGKEFYDYRDKYLDEGAELIHIAELPEDVRSDLRRLAVAAFRAVGGSGMARVDFLLDQDGPKINEINTLPGFTSISMYPKLWHEAGVPIAELVTRLIDCAERRHADRRRVDDGIKDWIASLA
jgi:D-alanine-D-alanine ligase